MLPDFDTAEVRPENEQQPYHVLPQGIHQCSREEFRQKLVDGFTQSQSRAEIFNGFEKLCLEAVLQNLDLSHWACGSFVTSKTNPDDMDICSFGDADILNQLHINIQQQLLSLFNGREQTKRQFHTHAFFIPVYPSGHQRHDFSMNQATYWYKWFGKTRDLLDSQNPNSPARLPPAPKGIARLVTGDETKAPNESALLK